jgi:predicted transcriptional regulator
MATYSVTLQIPQEIHERVSRLAEGMGQPLPKTLLKVVEAGLPSLKRIPAQYQHELWKLETLSDTELGEIAEGEMPETQQRNLSRLLRKSQAGTLTQREHQKLNELRTEANRLMLLKSYAYVLLKWRGYEIPTLADLMKE